jgi:RIO kinase 1
MPSNYDQYDLLEELDEIAGKMPKARMPHVKNAPQKTKRPRLKDKYNIITEPEVAHAIFAQREDLRFLDFTYQPSLTEREWLIDSLGGFFDQKWFDDILNIIKGGKEASVYQVEGNATTGEPFLAAKVYRPRVFRALRNDALYKEGRALFDADGLLVKKEGELKAVRKGTSFGKDVSHTSWIQHEVRNMQTLHEAGYDVPRYFANDTNAILMEYLGDAGTAAPTLIDVHLDTAEARLLYQRTLHNIEGMLRLGIIHGDLSAYNILYWNGSITLIDFPQAIHPDQNRNAYAIFQRDVTRICEYFARYGVQTDLQRLAPRLWTTYRYPLTPDFDLAALDPEDETDREFWEKYS